MISNTSTEDDWAHVSSVLITSTHQSIGDPWKVFTVLVVCYLIAQYFFALSAFKSPLVGVRSAFEPISVSSWRFFMHAQRILNEGHRLHKREIFKIRRADTDMLVLPSKYVNDIRNLPNHIASPTIAHVHNLMGSSTDMSIILQNNLHFRTLQLKLTPNLGALTHPMQEEANFAIEHEFPACDDDWVRIKPYHLILDMVARVSARIFLGRPLCRDKGWLEISTQFTENVFISLVFLRLFPFWMHPILTRFMPSRYRSSSYIRRAKRLLVPEIRRRQKVQESGEELQDPLNLLSWMLEIATEDERKPESLAHLEVVISLASIHTSQMNAVHVIYDLLEHPEYLELIREEIRETVKECGPYMSWSKSDFTRLRKLDSFMRESQRHNPPTLLSMHRVLLQPVTLSDGTVLPKNAHISMAVNAIQNDPEVTSEPETFDGLRYYHLRERPGEGHLHQFATTTERTLNFGHGPNSCPGRFFASLEIKIVLVRLLMDYDFRLLSGQGRPKNVHAHEFIFPNPDAEIEVKRRRSSDRLVVT